jgi:hypothetical protein
MSHVILRGCWIHINFLNVYAQTDNQIDDVNDSFCKKLESVCDKFSKYHMKFLLEDFNVKVCKEVYIKFVMIMELE